MKKSPKLTLTDWSGVAKKLCVSRQALNQWRKLPGAPETPDVEAWKRFRDDRDLGKGAGNGPLAQLRAEKLRVDIEAGKLRNAQMRGQFIPAEEVRAFDMAYAGKLTGFLRVKLELEAPPRLVGKDITETRMELCRIFDEISEFQRNGVMKWEPSAQAVG